jgi:multisubunit Na+/H+ antiporter MnhF subunit
MSLFFAGVVVLLAITVLSVLSWWVCASTSHERVLAATFSGSLGVALLLLLAEVAEVSVLRDAALVLAVLGAVTVSTTASRPQVPRSQVTRPGVAEGRAR